MSYPDAIIVGGAEYEINTDYTYALACIACVNDAEISDVERAYGVIGLLYKQEPPDTKEALRLAVKYLSCGKEANAEPGKPDMDYEYDMHYIRSSFRSDYGVDLSRTEYMHWWEFCELLQGLNDNSILNRVRDLRNYDLSTVRDAKLRSRIIKAQQEVSLPERLTAEEQEIIDDFEAQFL
jgi:hypothetical protein